MFLSDFIQYIFRKKCIRAFALNSELSKVSLLCFCDENHKKAKTYTVPITIKAQEKRTSMPEALLKNVFTNIYPFCQSIQADSLQKHCSI